MRCREYIFLLTSDQLTQASRAQALEAGVHRWVCRHCRRFTHNDELLRKVLQQETQLWALTPPDRS